MRGENFLLNFDVLPAHRNGTEAKSFASTSEDMWSLWWREKRRVVKEWSALVKVPLPQRTIRVFGVSVLHKTTCPRQCQLFFHTYRHAAFLYLITTVLSQYQQPINRRQPILFHDLPVGQDIHAFQLAL